MAKQCNFYLDTGSDFNANVIICGINNKPVHVDNFRFTCTAYLVYNPKIKISIQATPIENMCGVVGLYIPASEARKLPQGEFAYSLQCFYEDMSRDANRTLTVLTGKIIVNDSNNRCW